MNRQEWRRRSEKKPPRFPWWWMLLVAVSAVMVITGLAQIVSRWTQDSAARRAADEMRELYRGAGEFPTASPTPLPTSTPADTPTPELIVFAEASPKEKTTVSVAPTTTPEPRIEAGTYPPDQEKSAGERFRALRKENQDIVGWLTIGSMIDEAVVQRDNLFYMNHDVKRGDNINGAIFLDEIVSLKTRPMGLILYGHNMRTGAMFGSLRNYENVSFYHNYPFLTFDTMHENGRYVIFAVGTVDVEHEDSERFLDFFSLTTRSVQERERAIEVLKSTSIHTCTVDVQAEDQLLLLVTCVDQDAERRVVAARRIRDGERETELKRAAGRSR